MTDTLDLDALLKPISRKAPAGVDLRADGRHDSPYQSIKAARAEARNIERRIDAGDDHAGSPQPNWRLILELGSRVLEEESKDLEVAAYLTEALVRERGFAGLRDGFRLVRRMVDQSWDDLYPRPDEDGVVDRITHLAGLNGVDNTGTLVRPILSVPITGGATIGPFSCADFKQARQLESLPAEEQTLRAEDGAVLMPMIEQAVAETPPEFFAQTETDIRECLDEFREMSAVLDDKCGPHAPHTSNIRNALEECAETLRYLARLGGVPTSQPGDEQSGATAAGSPDGTPVRLSTGSISSRQDALAVLREVARYFREAEPHSPLSFACDQIVRWGNLPLPDLLNELIPDNSARTYLFTLTGIEPPAEAA